MTEKARITGKMHAQRVAAIVLVVAALGWLMGRLKLRPTAISGQ